MFQLNKDEEEEEIRRGRSFVRLNFEVYNSTIVNLPVRGDLYKIVRNSYLYIWKFKFPLINHETESLSLICYETTLICYVKIYENRGGKK